MTIIRKINDKKQAGGKAPRLCCILGYSSDKFVVLIHCNGNQVELWLEGSNTLNGGDEGIRVPAASKLTIGGDGELDVKGGPIHPAIGSSFGGCGEILITDYARVDADSGTAGAGIGTAANAGIQAGIGTITGNAVASAQGGFFSGPDIGSDNVNGRPARERRRHAESK